MSLLFLSFLSDFYFASPLQEGVAGSHFCSMTNYEKNIVQVENSEIYRGDFSTSHTKFFPLIEASILKPN
jgi:hypothetical protein